MRKTWILGLVCFLILGILLVVLPERRAGLLSPLLPAPPKPRPLLKYSFENLRQRQYQSSEINLEKIIKKEATYTSWLFSYLSDGKKITGQANIPATRSPTGRDEVWPVIVMLRGYIDDKVYYTGAGTQKIAKVFAENGFITLAPDFLGFGGSDPSSTDVLEARFNRPIEVLNLLASVKTLPQAETKNVFFWAHSNGGQVALSVLEITRRPIPTILWAPVTIGFPDSILYFMKGDLDEQGKKVKERIDEFLSLYDNKDYSIHKHFSDISAPIQIHQGLADDSVPVSWSDYFVKELKSLGKEVTYYRWPGTDHNLKPSWEVAVNKDIDFFKKIID